MNKTIRYQLSNKGIIKISEEVNLQWLSYRQLDKKDTEAGGVLLGRFIKDGKNIVIDKVTIPLKADERTHHSFIRSKKHQRIIDKEWKQSGGTCNYLGEWHTHPEDFPTPSRIDLDNWQERLKKDLFSSRYLYFVIVGNQQIRIWEGDKRTLRIKKLTKYE